MNFLKEFSSIKSHILALFDRLNKHINRIFFLNSRDFKLTSMNKIYDFKHDCLICKLHMNRSRNML